MAGRPRDRAPNGHVTVREAAEILGVSDQAVRARIARGTLPERSERSESGEVRHYIPRDAINEALTHGSEIVTREETDELHVAASMLTNKVVGEIRRNREEITKRMDEDSELMREMAESEKEHQRHITQILKQEQERQEHFATEIQRWRIFAYVALLCLILIAVLIAGDQFGLW